MTDDGGVLENLPRSRPGRRSEKRASPGAGAATKRSRARPKGSASRTGRRAEDRQPQPAARQSPDPVGDAIRGAAKVAETGVRVAGTVARELLRRVPRP
jgi:hypothetical protein